MAVGIVIGVLLFPDMVDKLIPVLENTFGDLLLDGEGNLLPSMTLVWIIFAKNLQTAVLCYLTAKITRGILPGLILFFNGAMIGTLAIFLHQQVGLAYTSYIIQLLPHGIIELPALFLACAIGMHGIRINGWKAMLLPAGMLVIAALVEIYISTLLV